MIKFKIVRKITQNVNQKLVYSGFLNGLPTMKATATKTYWKIETKKTDEFSRQGNSKADIFWSHLLAAYHGSRTKTTTVAA